MSIWVVNSIDLASTQSTELIYAEVELLLATSRRHLTLRETQAARLSRSTSDDRRHV